MFTLITKSKVEIVHQNMQSGSLKILAVKKLK